MRSLIGDLVPKKIDNPFERYAQDRDEYGRSSYYPLARLNRGCGAPPGRTKQELRTSILCMKYVVLVENHCSMSKWSDWQYHAGLQLQRFSRKLVKSALPFWKRQSWLNLVRSPLKRTVSKKTPSRKISYGHHRRQPALILESSQFPPSATSATSDTPHLERRISQTSSVQASPSSTKSCSDRSARRRKMTGSQELLASDVAN